MVDVVENENTSQIRVRMGLLHHHGGDGCGCDCRVGEEGAIVLDGLHSYLLTAVFVEHQVWKMICLG